MIAVQCVRSGSCMFLRLFCVVMEPAVDRFIFTASLYESGSIDIPRSSFCRSS